MVKFLEACKECGLLKDMDGISAMIPRRCLPQAPLELPTEGGWWWVGFPMTLIIHVAMRGGVPYHASGPLGGDPLIKGHYFKCTPPLVAKAVDEDAEWCKSMKAGESYYVSTEVYARLQRIVARLEREGKHE